MEGRAMYSRYEPRLRRAVQILSQTDQDTTTALRPLLSSPSREPQPNDIYDIAHRLGVRPDILEGADPAEAARMLASRDPKLMAPYHVTAATSLWSYFGQPHHYHPDLIQELDRNARRITWAGKPYVPAARWEFDDGSAIVAYGSSVMAGVHRQRLDDIAAPYMEIARESLKRTTTRARMNSPRAGLIPLAPHPAFAPASDGQVSHQAALPLRPQQCWCPRTHPIWGDDRINLRPT